MISDDGAKTWTAHRTPVTRTLTGIAFKDAKVGVAVGHNASLIRTEDGGSTWTRIPMEEAGTDSLLSVTWLGGDRFLAYGAFALMFDSTDAGKTWTRVKVIGDDFDRHLSQVVPVGEQLLLLVGESGTLATSADGGATWTPLQSPYPGSFFGALVAPDGSWLAYGMRGNIWRTADMGKTWQKIDIGTTSAVMAGKVLSDGRVVLAGNVGLVAVSSDNGQTLTMRRSPNGKGIAQIIEVGQGTLLGVGEGGVEMIDPALFAK
jgi:photosystem II stability/assembly factor-like uncharacterized protein